MRTHVLLLSGIVLLMLPACEKAAPAPSKAAGAPSGAAGATDTVHLYSRAARFLDKYWASRTSKTITLTRKGDVVSDADGNVLKMSATEWSDLVAFVKGTPEKKFPIRALPAGAKKHDDGLGRLKKNAWLLYAPSDDRLEATFIKTLEGESE